MLIIIIIIITIINVDIIIKTIIKVNKEFLPEVEVTWYNIDVRACYCY